MAITIKCHGSYYFKAEKDKGIRPFDEIVKAPSMAFFNETNIKLMGTDDDGKLKFKETTFANVRGRLKKKLLDVILSRKIDKYPNYMRVRSVIIDEITSDNNERLELPINLMSIKQLGELIKDRRMPIDANSYMEIDELRSDIMAYTEDPENFLKGREVKDKRRQEEREFLELNGLTDDPNGRVAALQAKVQKATQGQGKGPVLE